MIKAGLHNTIRKNKNGIFTNKVDEDWLRKPAKSHKNTDYCNKESFREEWNEYEKEWED